MTVVFTCSGTCLSVLHTLGILRSCSSIWLNNRFFASSLDLYTYHSHKSESRWKYIQSALNFSGKILDYTASKNHLKFAIHASGCLDVINYQVHQDWEERKDSIGCTFAILQFACAKVLARNTINNHERTFDNCKLCRDICDWYSLSDTSKMSTKLLRHSLKSLKYRLANQQTSASTRSANSNIN